MKPRFSAMLAGVAVAATTLTACAGPGETAVDDDCTPIAEVETVRPGTLTALVAEYPPYVTQEGGELTGIDGALIARVADALCLELDAQTTSFAAVIEGLQSGRADISAGDWSLNAERAELFEPSEGVYQAAAGIVSTEGYSSAEDLEGLRVGTPQGYLWVEDFQTILGRDGLSLYQSEAAIFDDIVAGRLDAGIVGAGAAAFRLDAGSYEGLGMEELEPDERIEFTQSPPRSVALISKGNTALRDAVNQVLDEYFASGELESSMEDAGLDSGNAYPDGR